MCKLTLFLESFGHKELELYLKSLEGINDVKIKNDNKLEIFIDYDSNLINYKMIKMEIFLFLNILKIPSLISFNKHSKADLCEYKIIKNDICCEYCFRGTIEDLFDIDGIEKVESSFKENKNYLQNCNDNSNFIIKIYYNPNLITINEIKKIELNLN